MLENLTTETRNKKTMNLDEMSIIDLLTIMNEEDARVAEARLCYLFNKNTLILGDYRSDMVSLAIEENPKFILDTHELNVLPGKHYTYYV